jgi:ribonuclease P/MRP protein subunit RPP40
LVNLFKSYLVSRTHLVEIQNVRSNLVMPTSGVPQGSNLGPLLFLIFINDLPPVINCHKLLFADDLKIYCEITVNDCESLQGDINSLVNWCNVNHLILNIEKCSIMTFSRTLSPISNNYKIGDVLLSRKESVDDLGILFDKGLSFVDHINSITSTAFKNLGYIYRNCKSFRDIAC